jgi:nucleoside-diphosphate-sugar epimerase
VVHVVVTGGSGFLGSRLARELLAAGSIAVDGGEARPLTRVTVLDQAPGPRGPRRRQTDRVHLR